MPANSHTASALEVADTNAGTYRTNFSLVPAATDNEHVNNADDTRDSLSWSASHSCAALPSKGDFNPLKERQPRRRKTRDHIKPLSNATLNCVN